MNRKLSIAPVIVGLAIVMGAAACGSSKNDSAATTAASTATTAAATATTKPAEAVKIGFITKFPVDFYDTMVDAAKTWNKDHPEAEVLFAQGKSGTDDEGQIAAIQSMVTQGVKAIAITPTSPNVQGELQKAVDKGIKVVLVDNDIPGWDGKSALVATDNLAGGKLAGAYMAKQLKAGDEIAILAGVPGAPSLDDRVTGFKDTLGDGFKIVATLPTDCDQTKGLNAAQDILTANPNVAAIYGACGPPILGALEAIGGKKIAVIGFDASPGEIEAILAGKQLASVAQFPAKMGSLGADAALKAALGQKVEANIDTGTEMVTKDNAAKFK